MRAPGHSAAQPPVDRVLCHTDGLAKALFAASSLFAAPSLFPASSDGARGSGTAAIQQQVRCTVRWTDRSQHSVEWDAATVHVFNTSAMMDVAVVRITDPSGGCAISTLHPAAAAATAVHDSLGSWQLRGLGALSRNARGQACEQERTGGKALEGVNPGSNRPLRGSQGFQGLVYGATPGAVGTVQVPELLYPRRLSLECVGANACRLAAPGAVWQGAPVAAVGHSLLNPRLHAGPSVALGTVTQVWHPRLRQCAVLAYVPQILLGAA